MFLKALVGLSDKGTRVKIQLHICVCGFILYASCHLHQYHLWESLNYGLLFCSFGLWDTCLCNAADMNWTDSYTLLTGKTKTGAEVCAMHRPDNTTGNSLAKWLCYSKGQLSLFFIYLFYLFNYLFYDPPAAIDSTGHQQGVMTLVQQIEMLVNVKHCRLNDFGRTDLWGKKGLLLHFIFITIFILGSRRLGNEVLLNVWQETVQLALSRDPFTMTE